LAIHDRALLVCHWCATMLIDESAQLLGNHLSAHFTCQIDG
jgi:hypothetical protein